MKSPYSLVEFLTMYFMYMEVYINGVFYTSWIFLMEHQMKIEDLGVPLFRKISICGIKLIKVVLGHTHVCVRVWKERERERERKNK